MKRISSENLDQCTEYIGNRKLYGLAYASFLKCLATTMEKNLPVEVLDNDTNKVFKGFVMNFSISYEADKEGEKDNLTIKLKDVVSDKEIPMDFIETGKSNVREDKKSSSRSFYRYYLYGSNKKGYRFTFNRRISKNT